MKWKVISSTIIKKKPVMEGSIIDLDENDSEQCDTIGLLLRAGRIREYKPESKTAKE